MPHSFALFANEWERLIILLHRRRVVLDFQFPLLTVDPQQAGLSVGVGTKATPFPLAGLDYHASLHRVAMHVPPLRG